MESLSYAERVIKQAGLSALFDDESLSFDLRKGLIFNPAETRLYLMTTDLLEGIYQGLVTETGPAWPMVIKGCGQVWGERVAQRLDRECQIQLGRTVGEMPLSQYLGFLTGYFWFHGWGVLSLNIEKTASHGVLQATLKNSIWGKVVDDPVEMADPMIAGMLGALMSYISGHSLDCVQTSCPTKGAEHSQFVITAAERLKNVPAEINTGLTHQELVARLCH